MKILNERYVCKPLNIRELSFYQKLPEELLGLVPAFHGTVSLNNTDSPLDQRFVQFLSPNAIQREEGFLPQPTLHIISIFSFVEIHMTQII